MEDLATGSRRRRLTGFTPPLIPDDRDAADKTLTLSRDGRLLAGGAESAAHGSIDVPGKYASRAMLWSTGFPRPRYVWQSKPFHGGGNVAGPHEPVETLAFTPDGAQLVESKSSGYGVPGKLQVRSSLTGKVQYAHLIGDHNYDREDQLDLRNCAIVYSRNGILAVGREPNVLKTPGVWNLRQNRLIGLFPNGPGDGDAAFDGNSRVIVAHDAGDGSLQATRRSRRVLWKAQTTPSSGPGMAVSASGAWLADDETSTAAQGINDYATRSTPITLRAAKTGAPLGMLGGPAGGCGDLTFCDHDRLLVAISGDGVVRVWQRAPEREPRIGVLDAKMRA